MNIQDTVGQGPSVGPEHGEDRSDAEGQSVHWADLVADKIVRFKTKDGKPKDSYTCASGITPSGTVHIGNFREIISVELVVRALRERGKQVRFIYSWDDYDVFRKVPKNMPNQDVLASHLRWPITMVPDPYEKEESYARHHEVDIENILPAVGVAPEYLYQAKRYRASQYASWIRHSLEKKDLIRKLLDEFRTEELSADWWPISVFSSFTNKDTTTVLGWDGEWGVTYRCDETGKTETVDLRTSSVVKLPWRIDWPMRWRVEGVDFEPAGKDHHSEGGSWSTAEKICKEVFGIDPPITFQYDFISIKGRGGKISSSSGEVIDLYDVLEVYTPELVRYLFAGTRPNTEFAISYDLDTIKIYEDYDRTERIAYGKEAAVTDAKKIAKEKRMYELSQVKPLPEGVLPFMPLQIPFRHLCNLLLIYNGDADRAFAAFPAFAEAKTRGELDENNASGAENLRRLRNRAACAWKWMKDYAPEDFKFSLRSPDDAAVELSAPELASIVALRELAAKGFDQYEEKPLQDEIYNLARGAGIEPKAFFEVVYRVLIGKTQGPRLAGFIKTLGKEHILNMLAKY